MTRICIFLIPMLLMTANAGLVKTEESNDKPQRQAGQLSEDTLGSALKSIGLKPTKTEKRYDFAFKTSIGGEEWKFSMSTVLSRNE